MLALPIARNMLPFRFLLNLYVNDGFTGEEAGFSLTMHSSIEAQILSDGNYVCKGVLEVGGCGQKVGPIRSG